jgi:hypothetical protein
MKLIHAISMTIILTVSFCFTACAGNMPATENTAAVELRLSRGWWVRINQDGSGSYGFGVLVARVKVMKSTFAFKDILEDIRRVFDRKPKNAEAPYMAVSFRKKGSSSAEEYPLAKDNTLLAKLFGLARYNAVPPANKIEKAWYDQIEEFWTKHPPIFFDKPDSGEGQ